MSDGTLGPQGKGDAPYMGLEFAIREGGPAVDKASGETLNYPDRMRQTLIADLKSLNITDEQIVRAAAKSDLDQVAALLEAKDSNSETRYVIGTIKRWRQELVGSDPEPLD